MANTFIKIAAVTVGSGGASSIEFASIPATYTDICILVSARTDRAATRSSLGIAFNGSTTGITIRRLYGEDGAVGSDTGSGNSIMYVVGDTATANVFSNGMLYFPNYASSNYKSVSEEDVSENNSTTKYDLFFHAGLWSNTAAINKITLTPFNADNLKQYSTATLYGIKNS